MHLNEETSAWDFDQIAQIISSKPKNKWRKRKNS